MYQKSNSTLEKKKKEVFMDTSLFKKETWT